MSPDLPLEIQCFGKHLDNIIRDENLYSALDSSPEAFDINDMLLEISAHYIDVSKFVKTYDAKNVKQLLTEMGSVGELNGRRLVIAPCSPLFDDVVQALGEHYQNVVLLDQHRKGSKVGNLVIEDSTLFNPADGDFCFTLTRSTQATRAYEKLFGRSNCINALREFSEKSLYEISPDHGHFLEIYSEAPKPVLFSSPKPLSTLSSTVRELGVAGFSPFWLGSEEVKESSQVSYSNPKLEDVAFKGHYTGGLADQIRLFCRLPKGTILYHFEALYPPNWDFNRVAMCYAATLAMIRTVKECRPDGIESRFALHMYDAIKPGVKNYQAGVACGHLYQSMMREAEGIVFSSYTEEFGDFVENSVGKKLPRVHGHRYQTIPKNRRPRLTDGYHIAILSVMLEEFWEPSRMGIVPYIREIIAQGIHIHYYASVIHHGKIQEFADSLPAEHQERFHLHLPIHDLDELSDEISQYHAGWSLFNMQVFNDMTTYLDDQFTKDAMSLFTPTTLPSVIWSCAAAGLPVICNRAMEGVVDMLPEGMTIPLTLSELGCLKNILEEMNWEEVNKIQLDDLDISNQIYKLVAFLNGNETLTDDSYAAR